MISPLPQVGFCSRRQVVLHPCIYEAQCDLCRLGIWEGEHFTFIVWVASFPSSCAIMWTCYQTRNTHLCMFCQIILFQRENNPVSHMKYLYQAKTMAFTILSFVKRAIFQLSCSWQSYIICFTVFIPRLTRTASSLISWRINNITKESNFSSIDAGMVEPGSYGDGEDVEQNGIGLQ